MEINAALNSLPATGGCVYMKEGTYNTIAPIIVPYDNVAIMGCGRSTIITNGGVAFDLIEATNLTGLIFTDFYLYNGGRRALDLVNCDESFINRLWVTDSGNTGIEISGDDCIISNCIISNNVNGIAGGAAGERWIISNNQINNNSALAINLANFNFNRIMISNNQIYSNDNSGIGMSGNHYLVSNNIIRENARGIEAAHVSDPWNYNNIIVGNVIDSHTNSGIWLAAENYETIVSDNQIINNGWFGIQGTDPAGIYNNQRNKATGNIFRNNTSGNFQDMGVFDEIFDNLEL